MAKRVLVVGSSNIDFMLSTPYIPAPGETLLSQGAYSFVPGGKGANAAVAAANLGASVVFCSRVGDDAYGDRLKMLFSEKGIDTRFVSTDRFEQTGLAVVMIEKGGTNRIIVYPGANRRIAERDVDDSFSCYPDAVLSQLEIAPDTVIAASRRAAEDGIPFFLDAGPATPDFPLEKLEKLEIISPNETETEILTGIRPNNLNNCLRASIALCNRTKIRYVVLKLGARGCYVYDGKYCDLISPYDVSTVDTTAAGDAFTAALTVQYLRTGDIIESARFANAAGALAVTKLGALNSMPDLESVLTLMNS